MINKCEYKIDRKEAFKLMLDNKLVISDNGHVYEMLKRNISKKKNSTHIAYLDYPEFLLDDDCSLFKEYIPLLKPRKFEFEAFIGEKPDGRRLLFQELCTDKVFGHETTGLYSEKKYLEDYINYFNKISKFKVTMEEILE